MITMLRIAQFLRELLDYYITTINSWIELKKEYPDYVKVLFEEDYKTLRNELNKLPDNEAGKVYKALMTLLAYSSEISNLHKLDIRKLEEIKKELEECSKNLFTASK